MEKIEEDKQHLKEIEEYSASVNYFYNMQLEHTKSLLYLSSGAISLLLAFVSKDTDKFISIDFILYISSLFCFLISLFCSLKLFTYKSEFLAEDISKVCTDWTVLGWHIKIDRVNNILNGSFFLGIVISVLLIVYRQIFV